MTNHALCADATGSGGGVGASKVIADGNGDQERLARAGETFGATVRRPPPQRNRLMTNHALTPDPTGSGGGAGGSEVIADGNGEPERLAHAGELSAQLSDGRSLRGIAR